jgi:hypothetical protein
MAGESLTLTVNNEYPINQSPVNSAGGGNWGAKTISIRVVAWYTLLETNVDNAGINRDTVGQWENKSVGSNEQLYFTFVPVSRPVNHYSFYYQEAATWDSDNPCKKCTATFSQTGTSQILCTVVNDDDTATITFGDATTISITNLEDIVPTIRQVVTRAYDGTLVPVSYATVGQLVSQLDITASVSGKWCTGSEYKTILRWIKYATQIKITESLTGDDCFLDEYTGIFINTNYLPSRYKAHQDQVTLTYLVETESEL